MANISGLLDASLFPKGDNLAEYLHDPSVVSRGNSCESLHRGSQPQPAHNKLSFHITYTNKRLETFAASKMNV